MQNLFPDPLVGIGIDKILCGLGVIKVIALHARQDVNELDELKLVDCLFL